MDYFKRKLDKNEIYASFYVVALMTNSVFVNHCLDYSYSKAGWIILLLICLLLGILFVLNSKKRWLSIIITMGLFILTQQKSLLFMWMFAAWSINGFAP